MALKDAQIRITAKNETEHAFKSVTKSLREMESRVTGAVSGFAKMAAGSLR